MDTVDPARFIFAFILVLGLIGLMALFLKYWGNPQKLGRKLMGTQSSGRIQIIETAYIDPRRRLVLVKRDDTEHLLLLAPDRELVIESGIKASMIRDE